MKTITGHLNSKKVKVCNSDVFVIQTPTVIFRNINTRKLKTGFFVINQDGKIKTAAGAAETGTNETAPEEVDKKPDVGADFGLRTDQYDRRNAALKRATAATASRDWTEQETLLLLEGLELFKDDWNKVCTKNLDPFC